MDLSNEQDLALRVECAKMAKDILAHPECYPASDFITLTRDAYLFLRMKDPVIDLDGSSEADNVIHLSEYR